jgi:hypothetical protein
MVKVALHIQRGSGRQQGRTDTETLHCRAQGDPICAKILKIIGLAALFFLLAMALPLNAAHASESDDLDVDAIQLLPYEKAEGVQAGLVDKNTVAPQQRSYKDLSKKDQKAVLAQFAIGAIGNAFYSPLARALNAVQEPIRSDDGKFACRTKLSFSTAYMRCGLKF